jgi:hypothetical protein
MLKKVSVKGQLNGAMLAGRGLFDQRWNSKLINMLIINPHKIKWKLQEMLSTCGTAIGSAEVLRCRNAHEWEENDGVLTPRPKSASSDISKHS